ncbi:GNAT family N-acetyltransferase [Pseudomonas oryzihabitans]|uniref:GNAT family N-acetyltransferase n=1 Tax=Pseudomonas oryzihabitans TaxID=47885 RepID=UPI0018D97B91|nr:GNAT family N-acetyltransferase [Pseudomonas oryzihabitans]MBH3332209.1 GNAT family N-acetyltransferase [Pseudomonas oryzihabitans]
MSTPAFSVEPLTAADLPATTEVVRLAFATWMGAAEPGEFWNDRDYVRSRFAAPHTAWFKALDGARLVGAICVTRWGRHGILGPLAVHPDYWDAKVAKALMGAAVAQLDAWQLVHAGLFTFPDSPLHLGLYQGFGFWPQTLTAVMARPVQAQAAPPALRFSLATEPDRLLAACADVGRANAPGLDVSAEMAAVRAQGLGESLLLQDAQGRAEGFAVCHFGPHSEAGTGVCYVKCAAVLPGAGAEARFARLIAACDGLARDHGQQRLLAGVNTARRGAYQWLWAQGFHSEILGITLHRGEAHYDHPEVWLLDDWR